MSGENVFLDGVLGFVAAFGFARVFEALEGWPKAFPSDWESRQLLAQALSHRVGRVVHASGWITLALVGLLRGSALYLQLPLWAALVAIAWATTGFPWFTGRAAPDALARTNDSAVFAQVMMTIAALGALAGALVRLEAAIWLMALGGILLAAGRVDALLGKAAAEVLTLRSEPAKLPV